MEGLEDFIYGVHIFFIHPIKKDKNRCEQSIIFSYSDPGSKITVLIVTLLKLL